LNVDHTLRVPRIPVAGETLAATGALTSFGGKGANQALAAARAGGDVVLVGCLGDDDFGAQYLEYLQGEGIDTSAIARASVPTGSAFITVDDAGDNAIVVNAGANGALHSPHLDAYVDQIRSAAALLLQFECPLPAVRRAVEIASAAQVPVILNPSPLTPEFLAAGFACDVLIANELEAVALFATTPSALAADPWHALSRARCRTLVITRGGDSTIVITSGRSTHVAPPKITPVDTVGAGDAFAGAFSVAHAGGLPLELAVCFANAAGALATQKVGAQSSIPRREEINRLLENSPDNW
jgi:ribokinase